MSTFKQIFKKHHREFNPIKFKKKTFTKAQRAYLNLQDTGDIYCPYTPTHIHIEDGCSKNATEQLDFNIL